MDDLCVIYDACVLYPAPLRDALVSLAVTRLFRARWTDEIHAEWIRNLLEKRKDLTREQLERTRRLMDNAVPDSLVTGYEQLVDSLSLPDQDDRHVLAAAIHAGAQVIVTFNVRDFPRDVLLSYGIETRDPDSFIAGLLEDHPDEVVSALRKMRVRMAAPPQSVEEFLELLARQRLSKSVNLLRQYVRSL